MYRTSTALNHNVNFHTVHERHVFTRLPSEPARIKLIPQIKLVMIKNNIWFWLINYFETICIYHVSIYFIFSTVYNKIELLPVLHNLFESIFATFCDLKKDDTGQTKAFQVDSNMGIINV